MESEGKTSTEDDIFGEAISHEKDLELGKC